jgi:hypothetical protein
VRRPQAMRGVRSAEFAGLYDERDECGCEREQEDRIAEVEVSSRNHEETSRECILCTLAFMLAGRRERGYEIVRRSEFDLCLIW